MKHSHHHGRNASINYTTTVAVREEDTEQQYEEEIQRKEGKRQYTIVEFNGDVPECRIEDACRRLATPAWRHVHTVKVTRHPLTPTLHHHLHTLLNTNANIHSLFFFFGVHAECVPLSEHVTAVHVPGGELACNVSSLFRHAPLTCLNLAADLVLPAEQIRSLLRSVREGALPNLCELRLSGHAIPADVDIGEALLASSSPPPLHSLHLKSCQLSQSQLRSLFEYIGSTPTPPLYRLDIAGNEMQLSDWEYLEQLLRHNDTLHEFRATQQGRSNAAMIIWSIVENIQKRRKSMGETLLEGLGKRDEELVDELLDMCICSVRKVHF